MSLVPGPAASARPRARSRLAIACAFAAVLLAVLPGPVEAEKAKPDPGPVTQPEVVLDGKGFGHGVGMPQDGAYSLGAAGNSAEEILATFYPGTELGEGGGTIDVSLDSPQPAIELSFPDGGEVRDARSGAQSPGFPVDVAPGGSVRLSADGGLFHAFPLAGATPATTTPPTTEAPTTTAPSLLGQAPASTPTTTPGPVAAPPIEPTSSRSLWAVPADGSVVGVPATGHEYRGLIEAAGAGDGIQLVNQIDVEEYLRGMGEVRDPGWPAASLQAQAIAARTYALRSAGGVLCSTDQCQVYLGATAEYGAMDAAVSATSGQVLRYRGALADTVYSASGGGFTATPEEGFGEAESGAPYLQAVQYPTTDPEPWTLRSSVAEMARQFGYGGTATDARVSRAGPSGRALEVTFGGDKGPLAVDGQTFQKVLKLRSTLFTLRVEQPPPPPTEVSVAAPPPPGVNDEVRISTPPGMAVLRRPAPAINRRPWIALALVLLVGAASVALRRVRAERSDT